VILNGIWTPYNLEFYPFTDVDELCNPCFRWRFLELLRGSRPHWGIVLKNPANNSQEFPQYFRVKPRFQQYFVTLMRKIARSTHPNSVLRSLRNPALLIDEIRGNAQVEDADRIAIEYAGILLNRLHNSGVLDQYQSNINTLYNLQILNEDFDIYRQDTNRVTLTQRANSAIGRNRAAPANTFYWRGNIAIQGILPIIHLSEQEIRIPLLIAGDFFNPVLRLSNSQNTPEGIHSFFIGREFHKAWILRESLAQMIDDGKFPNELTDVVTGDLLFSPHLDLNNYDFREFTIIVDCIDESHILNPQINFKQQTGQAAIIFHLLYQNYPGIVSTFQSFDPCPFRIGQTQTGPSYNCPLGGNMGCGMSDKRIENNTFPRDRIELNVYRFLRLLRDESVFSHEQLFKITRLFPSRLIDLNQYSDFWIGEIYQDGSMRWIFHLTMPRSWDPPEISDKLYDLCLITPFCFEGNNKVSFLRRLGNDFELSPQLNWNPWVDDVPFSSANSNTGNRVNCIIGSLSIDDSDFNLKRQKRQLVRAIHFQRSSFQNPNTRPDEILQERLRARFRRIGMASFGRFARFV